VVVGKFNPPHLGHLHLITTAAAQVDRVVVLLCDRADQTISAETRRRWLLDACPANVEVIITPDDLPAANEPWAARAIDVLGRQPHVAFTSEPWGPGWAAAMGAQHVMVDLERTAQPTSGTALRADLGANFEWLVPAARAELARRVVLVGAESTGKSTLAAALAESLGTVWVPEYGRFYWEGRRHVAVQDWTADEFVRLAVGQHRLADDLARKAVAGVVVLDTDALTTAVWAERYLGRASNAVERISEANRPDHYLVCAPDFEWVQDGTRESREHRRSMHEATLERVKAAGVAWTLLSGPPDERLARALETTIPLTRFEPLV